MTQLLTHSVVAGARCSGLSGPLCADLSVVAEGSASLLCPVVLLYVWMGHVVDFVGSKGSVAVTDKMFFD